MSLTKYQAHPYHLVEPSPWPLLQSFALLSLTASGVMAFHGYANGGYLLGLSAVITISIAVLWFRDVAAEGTYLGHHTFAVQRGLSLGVALFIISEVFFFLSLFWALFHSALAPTVELGAHWPPQGVDPLSPYEVPLLNTVILLSSGAAVTYAHHAIIEGNRTSALSGLVLTVGLAIVFTLLQGFEYAEAGFTIADSAFGSTLYIATGTHGVHVLIGTLFITVAIVRFYNYNLTTQHHLGLEASILYWHFVDVVWLVLYISVYWWGS